MWQYFIYGHNHIVKYSMHRTYTHQLQLGQVVGRTLTMSILFYNYKNIRIKYGKILTYEHLFFYIFLYV